MHDMPEFENGEDEGAAWRPSQALLKTRRPWSILEDKLVNEKQTWSLYLKTIAMEMVVLAPFIFPKSDVLSTPSSSV